MNVTTNYGYWEFWAPYDPQNGFFGEHKCIFDGANKKIYINPEVDTLDVRQDIYSDWKEWAQVRDNTKFLPAIRSIGGDPIGNNQFAGDMYFLINGWQLVVDHLLYVNGILFSDDYNTPYIIDYGGVIANVSNLALAYTSNAAVESAEVAVAVWGSDERTLTTPVPPTAVEIRQEIDNNSQKLDDIQTSVEAVPQNVWTTPTTITLEPGTFGHFLLNKILTVAKFLGLK
jgi:hypothetical protein